MNKDEALYEFLRGLRIAFTTASAYSREHPYYIKSVKDFKQKIDILFDFLNPIKINITPDSLFIDGIRYDKEPLYVDLAQMFHFRKIKSIELRGGLNVEELIDFLHRVSLPTREILRKGGIQNILKREENPHIYIEELDYSQFLKDEGEEFKDIWVYLFKEAIKKEAPAQINEFADNFEKIIKKFKVKDLFEDEELRENLYNFLAYLKDKEKDKFYSCTKDLLKFILKDKNITQEDKLDKIKVFFQHLNKDDFAEVLCQEILREDSFNYLSFKVLSRLIGEDAHKEIAPALEERIKNTEFLRTDPKIRKKIKELFSGTDSLFIPEFYRYALSSLFTGMPLEESFSFDRDLLPINYYFILLNLLAEENDRQSLSLISERLLEECNKLIINPCLPNETAGTLFSVSKTAIWRSFGWARINKERKLEYLKFLLDILDKKRKEGLASPESFKELDICIYNFIENASFEDEPIPGLEYFIDKTERSILGFNYYLEKLFNEGKINPYALRLLLKFFPERLPELYEELKKRHSDIEFLGKIVRGLERLDSFLSKEILKNIFYFSNNIIKLEVLRAMRSLSRPDNAFLFSILETRDIFLKKATLEILAKDEKARGKALEKLFFIPSPLGQKNKVIIENIMVIEDMELKEAQEYLVHLSQRRFFWNRDIRKKALQTLEKWHVRKD